MALELRGYEYTETGAARDGATVQVVRSDTGVVLTKTGGGAATTTTDANGKWEFTGTSAVDISALGAGVYADVTVTYGDQVRRYKGGVMIQAVNINLSGDLDWITYEDQGTTPGAPGAGLTRVFSEGGVLYYRAGASGARTKLGAGFGDIESIATILALE